MARVAWAWSIVWRLAVLAPLLAACATPPGPSFSQVGLASWYGVQHEGRKTASGDRFRMNDMTAAHKTLPMDTIVRVTNLETGDMVKVRINDRGPFVKGRIIDLSLAAAHALKFRQDGTARVRVEAYDADQE
jgi:rare lipoprotein A